MALFKILRGIAGNLANQPKVDGHAYFCWNDGTFWIDYKETADATEVKRKQINKESWTSDIADAVDAVKQWVEGKLVGKVDFFGTVSALTSLPTGTSVGAGDFCRVGTAFDFGSEKAHAGDMLVALKDNPSKNTTDWDLIHNEYDWTHTHNYTPSGTVSQPTFTGNAHKHTASFSGDTKSTSVKYTPGGSVSQPTFTGNAHKHTASFTGTQQTVSVDYTPTGSVSQPTFTGNAHKHTASFTGTQQTVSVDYTPAGSISKPGITVTPSTESIGSITGVGSLPALTAAYDSSSKRVTFSWSTGTLPTKTNKDVMTGATAALNATPTFTGTKARISHTLTPSGSVSIENTTAGGTVSQPTFSGSKATISHTFIPAGSVAIENTTATGSVSKPTFTGTESEITHSYTPSGTVTIENTTAGGTVSQPTFSGNQGTTGNPN
jgi:hypothetical protein